MPRHHKELDAWWVTIERIALTYNPDTEDADFFEEWWHSLDEARQYNDSYKT